MQDSTHIPPSSESASEEFGSLPNDAEDFRNVPKPAEAFGTLRKNAERTHGHTLTVREVARLFEAAGVARTERSIVTWCRANPQGLSRLDAYFDMNERKWFITQESVERVIAEEQARAAHRSEPLPNSAEESVPNASEQTPKRPSPVDSDDKDQTELHGKLRDLEIANRVKDSIINQLEGNLLQADEERRAYIQQLIEKSHRIGSLEMELRQLSAPRNDSVHLLPNHREVDV